MKLDAFNKDKQERLQKVADLKAEIEADEKALTEKEDAYKKAIVDGQDKKANELFPAIEELKKGIKSKKYRLETVEKITYEQIRENAYEAVMELKQIEADTQEKLDELDKKMMPLMQKQAELFDQANALKETYWGEKQAYERLIDVYKLERKELNTRGYNRNRQEPLLFRESKASPPVRQNTKPVDRKEKRNELPKDATLKDFADANRIIQEG